MYMYVYEVCLTQFIEIVFRMNAEVLKTRTEMPDILSVVSNHLFGQLEGYIIADNQLVVKKWEVRTLYMC